MVKKINLTNKVKLGLLAGSLGLCGLLTGYSYFSSDKINTKITDTDVKGQKYLIFTDDGTFENTDAWYRLKFKSSDLQGKAKGLVGKYVEIEKYAWRFGLTSTYENVVGIEEIVKEY